MANAVAASHSTLQSDDGVNLIDLTDEDPKTLTLAPNFSVPVPSTTSQNLNISNAQGATPASVRGNIIRGGLKRFTAIIASPQATAVQKQISAASLQLTPATHPATPSSSGTLKAKLGTHPAILKAHKSRKSETKLPEVASQSKVIAVASNRVPPRLKEKKKGKVLAYIPVQYLKYCKIKNGKYVAELEELEKHNRNNIFYIHSQKKAANVLNEAVETTPLQASNGSTDVAGGLSQKPSVMTKNIPSVSETQSPVVAVGKSDEKSQPPNDVAASPSQESTIISKNTPTTVSGVQSSIVAAKMLTSFIKQHKVVYQNKSSLVLNRINPPVVGPPKKQILKKVEEQQISKTDMSQNILAKKKHQPQTSTDIDEAPIIDLTDSESKEKSLSGKEESLSDKEKSLSDKEKSLSDKEKSLCGTEKSLSGKEKSVPSLTFYAQQSNGTRFTELAPEKTPSHSIATKRKSSTEPSVFVSCGQEASETPPKKRGRKKLLQPIEQVYVTPTINDYLTEEDDVFKDISPKTNEIAEDLLIPRYVELHNPNEYPKKRGRKKKMSVAIRRFNGIKIKPTTKSRSTKKAQLTSEIPFTVTGPRKRSSIKHGKKCSCCLEPHVSPPLKKKKSFVEPRTPKDKTRTRLSDCRHSFLKSSKWESLENEIMKGFNLREIKISRFCARYSRRNFALMNAGATEQQHKYDFKLIPLNKTEYDLEDANGIRMPLNRIVDFCKVSLKREKHIDEAAIVYAKELNRRNSLLRVRKMSVLDLKIDPNKPILVYNRHNLRHLTPAQHQTSNLVYLKSPKENYPESVIDNPQFCSLAILGCIQTTERKILNDYFIIEKRIQEETKLGQK